MPTIRLRLAEAAYLAAYLRRLADWEPGAYVRVEVRGATLGALGAPPQGCLTFIAVPLAGGDADGVTRVVSAGRFRDILGEVSEAAWDEHRALPIPDELGPVAALAMMPPRGPWEPVAAGTMAESAVDVARALGFLEPDTAPAEAACGRWLRLASPAGLVFTRRSQPGDS